MRIGTVIQLLLIILFTPFLWSQTWGTRAQNAAEVTCPISINCTVPFSATGAGNVGGIIVFLTGDNLYISSVFGAGIWTRCPGLAENTACHGFDTGNNSYVDFIPNYKLTGGATSATLTLNATPTNAYVAKFIEYPCTGGCTPTFHTATHDITGLSLNFTNPPGLLLPPAGTNDLVIQYLNPRTGTCSAITAPYNSDTDFTGGYGVAVARNQNGAPIAPIWTCTNTFLARGAIAISATVPPAIGSAGTTLSGNTILTGNVTVAKSFKDFFETFENAFFPSAVSGSGPIQVTLPGHNFQTGMNIFCAGFNGEINANGNFYNVTVSGNVVSLPIASGGVWTSGGFCMPSGAANATDPTGWTSPTFWGNPTPQVTTTRPHNGTKSIEFQFNNVCVGAAQDHNLSIEYDFTTIDGGNHGPTHIFFRGYFYLDAATTHTGLGVLRKLVYWWDTNGVSGGGWAPVIDVEDTSNNSPWYPDWLTFQPQYQGIATKFYSTGAGLNIQPATWYELEAELQANTPGYSDGYARYWLNDVLVMDAQGISMRGTWQTGFGIAQVGKQVNCGGTTTVIENRHWDDIVFSDKRDN